MYENSFVVARPVFLNGGGEWIVYFSRTCASCAFIFRSPSLFTVAINVVSCVFAFGVTVGLIALDYLKAVREGPAVDIQY